MSTYVNGVEQNEVDPTLPPNNSHEAYRMEGPVPDPAISTQVAAITSALTKASHAYWRYPGLVIQCEPQKYFSGLGRWFVSFNPPDEDHEEVWFWEASGDGHVINHQLFGEDAINVFIEHIKGIR